MTQTHQEKAPCSGGAEIKVQQLQAKESLSPPRLKE